MRLLSAWRKLLSGEDGDTGDASESGLHWRAGILAGLAAGTVAVHALAAKVWETTAARDEHAAPGEHGHQ
jgi:hypothetical protein